jgi:pimeloyl-ACP methyl ester carboxylesterase
MTLLQVGEQTLDYTEHTGNRDETPLIFIHGILSSQQTWLDFPLRFRQYGRILTLSLPGHYPARFPAQMPQSTITDRWVGNTMATAILQITGGKPAILIGHSTGGYASLAVAWRAPQLVQCVISLAGFARGTWTSLLGYLQQLHHLGIPGSWLFDTQVRLSTHNARMVDMVWRLCSYDKKGFAHNSAYWQMRPQIMQQAGRLESRAMRLWFYQMRTVADLTPHLPSIQVPVLAIAGSQDRIVPASQATLIADKVANGTGVLLDGMDHALFVEQPERVCTSMTNWLDRQHF